MKRVWILALAFAATCYGKEWRPNEVEISIHRKEVYALARDYVQRTFNLEIFDESSFNPVRFNSQGVWGNFEARVKELGGDRFEVQGWVHAAGHVRNRVRWTVHVRYGLHDPEAWRYSRIGEAPVAQFEVLGWKFGQYWSLGYEADYDAEFLASTIRGGAAR